jgi:hypothetical protein
MVIFVAISRDVIDCFVLASRFSLYQSSFGTRLMHVFFERKPR